MQLEYLFLMKASTMSSKLKTILTPILSVAFWLLIWEIGALCVDNSYFLPRISEVIASLGEIVFSKKFFVALLMTFLRVVIALIVGFALGILFGWLSQKYTVVYSLLKPLLLVIKSTPVASFIILLWATLNGNMLAIFIAFLMVFPIICEGTMSALDNISPELNEVCQVFKFGRLKRIRHLVIPTLAKLLVPSMITSVGLAWKAEVAAEIVGYVTNSIGAYINDALYDTPTVFAWTLIVIMFSILLEMLTKRLLRRVKADD